MIYTKIGGSVVSILKSILNKIKSKMPFELKKKEKKLEDYYVKPHNRVAREVTVKDMPQVLEDGLVMLKLCSVRRGPYPSAHAIAHSQISTKPLRFFVKQDGEVVVNPVIVRHSNYVVKKKEGCMTFKDHPMIFVDRWQKSEVEYETLVGGKLIKQAKHLSGKESEIWGHEIDHLDGKYIYSEFNK